ncbi:MAG: ATP-dependent RecD-like DNA helicase [Oligoflexia bacterium]|nr:ATP-dependent RecD-like DNA helicase [Oligoflexia bacterium]
MPKTDESAAEEIVRGVIRRITFRNPSNGYSVLKLNVADQAEGVTVVGTCIDAREGASVVVRGAYTKHPKFGPQLNAISIVEITPETAEGIEKYLGSGLIKGIGPKTAKLIVKRFGAETLEIIHREPERLAAVRGLGRKKALLLAEALRQQSEIREIMRFLVEHNVSTNLASRIYERYGSRAVETVTRDPYLLAREMRGIGFLTADTIALNVGLKPDSPQRLKAGLHYALEQASDEGHCFLSHEVLIRRARALLGLQDEYDLGDALRELLKEQYVVQKDDCYFLEDLARAEEFVAGFVARRLDPLKADNTNDADIQDALNKAEQELGLKFSAEQRQSVQYATHYQLMIITGGPGCGKTTVIRALTSVFSRLKRKVLLAAPTGRAAQRMSQVTSLPGSTIHRLLRFDPHRHAFLHGPNNPLPCDVLIIDESSMIDIRLARSLFSAVSAKTTLILVGDKDQLPSVGPGRVFADLISVPEVKTASLSQLFRRSEQSSINTIAHMINSGVLPNIPEPDGVTKTDGYFIAKNTPDEAATTIENLVADQLPRKFGFENTEISVLTPSNRGPLGTVELNRRLQARLNPALNGPTAEYYQLGETRFYPGDRVCQRVNNYNLHEAGVFNGDIGYVFSIDPNDRSLMVEMWDGRLIKYEQGEVGQLSLAYALTVHRSQGSEMPCVVLALNESHYNLLERQLLYTAVTRAKRLLVIVGSRRALAIATRRMESKKRGTMLRTRIKEICDPGAPRYEMDEEVEDAGTA